MTITKILYGHTSQETAKVIIEKDKRQRTTTRYCWIETKPGKGDRLVWKFSYPNTSQQSIPYYKKFAPLAFMYIDEEGKVQDERLEFDDSSKANKEKFVELMTKLDPTKLTSEQKFHIRNKIYNVFLSNAKAEHSQLSRIAFNLDWEWTMKTLHHIEYCPFPEIGNYPAFQVPPNWPLMLSRRYDVPDEIENLVEAE